MVRFGYVLEIAYAIYTWKLGPAQPVIASISVDRINYMLTIWCNLHCFIIIIGSTEFREAITKNKEIFSFFPHLKFAHIYRKC